jgi:uncharacterized membrane protein YfcA
MDTYQLILVLAVGFVISIFSVSVGGTALIIVPLLLWMGLDPKVAIGTTKFSVLFLSLTGAITFLRCFKLPQPKRLYPHALPVAAGSLVGATLVIRAPHDALKIIIACATIAVAVTLLAKREIGVEPAHKTLGHHRIAMSLAIVFPLSVYGGFFTGGYATLLSYMFVLVLGMTFLEAAAATRLMSVFSGAAASTLLGSKGLIDFSLGIPLAVAFSLGATLGARIAIRRGSRWLKTVFMIAAILLAVRILATEIYDLTSN